jgi:predicted dehydrogenase/dTDP-4-amino-4,6-dideoxygalactose transaminase
MKINHAIVGCGKVAPYHATAFQQLGVPVVACFDVSKERANAFAQSFGIPHAADSFAALLARPDITSVSLCTPHDLHAAMTLQALEAQKHALVEKPPILDLSDQNRIAEAAKSKNCIVMPVVQHRFDSLVVEVLKMLSSGALGSIRMLRGHLECARPADYYRGSDWRGSWAREGGSVLMNQGYHLLDLLQLIGGATSSVSAEMATFGSENKMETEDTVVAILCFKGGALGSLTITGAAGSQWSTYIEVLGSNGEVAFTIDYPGALVRFRLKEKSQHIYWRKRLQDACKPPTASSSPMNSHNLSHVNQARAFVDCIEGRQTREAAGWEEAVATVRLAIDIYHQARLPRAGEKVADATKKAIPTATARRPTSLLGALWNDRWEDVRPADAEGVAELVRRGEISIVSGGLLSRFEQRFADFARVRHGVAFNNGTSSLFCALWAVGVRPGDQVLVCDYGFHGMAAAILALGARLVACDCDEENLGLEASEILRRRTPRTKAVLVHHPWGAPAYLDRIREAAQDIPIISDASHAHGACFGNKPIAAWADITCFSLGRFKLVSGGELGCAVTDNVELRDRMLLYGHVNRVPQALRSSNWQGNAVGLKFRPHPAALSLALSQLARVDEKLLLSRQTSLRIEEMFEGFDLLRQRVPEESQRSYWKLVFRLGPSWSGVATAAVEQGLRAEGIPVEPNHYWPLLQEQAICDWADHRKLVVHLDTPIAHAVVPRTITLAAPVDLTDESFAKTHEALTRAVSQWRSET